MILPTAAKLQIARVLNRVLVGGRRLAGLSSMTRVKRNGAFWALDLNEGVELAIYLGFYQRLPASLLRSELKPGACVIDIGANIGAHTLPLAQAVGPGGQVLAVEPTLYAFEKLKKNLALNSALAGRIFALQCALTDGTGHAASGGNFYSRWPLNDAGTGLHARHGGKYESATEARFISLDDLLLELRSEGRLRDRISFVKLDVDGNELNVLTGSQKLLRDDRPVILMEIAPHVQDEVPGRFDTLVETLKEFGYGFESTAGRKALPNTASELRALIPHGASIDALLRPAG